jgi:hypothetical protein
MNAESITSWLLAVGVPGEVVSIGAEADNTWCLIRQEHAEPESGEVAVTWEVFWREQGNRYDWARFTNEQVACHYLFGRLTWAQVVRGAVGVLPDETAEPQQSTPAPAVEAKQEAAPEGSDEDTAGTVIPAGA